MHNKAKCNKIRYAYTIKFSRLIRVAVTHFFSLLNYIRCIGEKTFLFIHSSVDSSLVVSNFGLL